MPLIRTCLLVAVVVACAGRCAWGQSPINAPGAMQPSKQTGLWHVMPMHRQIGSDPTSNLQEGEEYLFLSQLAYGATPQLSLQFDAPIMQRELSLSGPGEDDEFGVGDMTLLAKYRLFKDDPAPTDTMRFSLIGGLQIPGNVDFRMDSANDAWDPIIGGVFSTVRGRHGFNADGLWEFYTGDDENHADSLRCDGSYLFRVSPTQYTEEPTGALYAVAELNGVYGTNGDYELYFSPGVMYESFKFTLDATVMIPIAQDVDHRAESEFLIGVGLRISL